MHKVLLQYPPLTISGEENPHHYLVASQDPEMRRKLRRVPGIPLMHIIRNTVVLEKPSDSTVDKADDVSVVECGCQCLGSLILRPNFL